MVDVVGWSGLAAWVAFFGDGGGVAGLANELVVSKLRDDLFGVGLEVAGFGKEEGGVAARLFIFGEGHGDPFEAVAVTAFADDLELVRVRRVFARDALVDVPEARLVGGNPLLA